MRKALIVISLVASACVTEPERVTVHQDPVAATKSRIAAEQSAGREAKQVCGELGLQNNNDCLGDIARARLGIDGRTTLPKFVNVAE